MEYTDGMEKIRGYLTEEQINAYEGLTESMDRLSLNLTDRINVLREFLEKEGSLRYIWINFRKIRKNSSLLQLLNLRDRKRNQRRKRKTMKRKI